MKEFSTAVVPLVRWPVGHGPLTPLESVFCSTPQSALVVFYARLLVSHLNYFIWDHTNWGMRTQVKTPVTSFASTWLPVVFLHPHRGQAWTPLSRTEIMKFFALPTHSFPGCMYFWAWLQGICLPFQDLMTRSLLPHLLPFYLHANLTRCPFCPSKREAYTHTICSLPCDKVRTSYTRFRGNARPKSVGDLL